MSGHNDFTTSIQLSHLLATEIGVSGDEATVIDTIQNSKELVTEDNLQQIVAELFHVNMSSENLRHAVHSLITQHKLYRDGQKLVISPQTLEEISKVSLENERIEETALLEWVCAYQEQFGIELQSEDAQNLKNSILTFVRTFFLKHGADCYRFIAGEKQSELYDIGTVAKTTAISKGKLEKEKVTAFLSSILTHDLSGAQTTFLLVQLKKAVHYLSMVVDHTTQDAMLKHLDGISIYLDTTILYRLFNLQGEKRYASIQQLVSFCQRANVRLKAFRTTVDELKRRIAYDAKVITCYPIPTSFARIGYNCRTAENYISTFWKEAQETGVSAVDFNYRYGDVIALLDSNNIEIDEQDYITEYCLADIVDSLREKVVRYSSSDPDFVKSPSAIDHDAQCLSMVSYLQIKSANSAIEAKTIFLSSDWSLIRLQRFDKEYKEKTDLVVLPSQLIQVFCMTAPTTDYFEAFLGLFSSSHTSFGTKRLENEQIQEIMGRVAMYKGTTPAFAERVLSNQLIQSTFTTKESEEEKNELIDDVMISTVEDMEKELEEKDETIQQSKDSLKKVEDKSKRKETTIEELSKRIESLETVHKTTSGNLDDTKNALTKYKENFERQSERKASLKAGVHIFLGVLLLTFGMGLVLVSTVSLVPMFSQFVEPIFLWIKSSSVIAGTSTDAIIGIMLTIGLAAISAGFFLVKPGYRKLKQDRFDNYLEKMNSNCSQKTLLSQ